MAPQSHKQGDYRGSQRPFEDERERLRKLAAGTNPATQAYMREIGIAGGWRCLELGAGEGSMCAWMAEQAGPAGRVLAADLDPRFLLDTGWPGVEIRKFDIREDAFEPNAFDLAYTRNTLLHLPDPNAALRKMFDALTPGGVLFAQDGDMCVQQAADPDHPRAEAVEHFFDVTYRYIRATKYFDTRFGRTLPARFRALGLEDVVVRATAEFHRSGSEMAASMRHTLVSAIGALVVADGIFSQRDVDEVLAAYDDPTFDLLSGIQLAVWGRKPA